MTAARSEAGFALAEALIAAAIVAAMVGVFAEATLTNAMAERMINDRRAAVLLARSAIEQAGAAGADPVLAQDGIAGRLRWTVTTSAYEGGSSGGPPLEQITVSVIGTENGRQLVRLTTLRLSR